MSVFKVIFDNRVGTFSITILGIYIERYSSKETSSDINVSVIINK